ncbi:very-long-chain 3-oxoacyl-CoA reductase-like [Macrobrachium rosenbergii]|uniref:very-long-chain 3-oxoacyl-CoA reductase-like n=1 Tax=Macrobrachium rosenbergii TaxID=79674 RepID=UPI0034D4311D
MWEAIGKLSVAFLVLRFGWSLLKGVYGSFIAAALGLNLNVKKTGEWAVVTGATDGIGKAYAFELARRGMKVVLISRTPFKLQNVAAEINTKYGVETKIIDVDFTKDDIYDRIEKELQDLDIGVLVNNVGMSYDHPEYFNKIADADKVFDQLINCNVKSLTKMTRIVLPGMEERQRGLVINLSSLSSIIPAPFLAVYGATKAYIESLTESLGVEYASKNITFQCILPGYVVSNMSKIRRPTLMAPTPTAFVRSSLRTTGVEKRTAGYFMHKLQVFGIEFLKMHLPGSVLSSIVFNQLQIVRNKALKRKEREAKAE